MRYPKPTAWVPVAVLIALAGCGGGGDDTVVSASPDPAAAMPAPAAEPLPAPAPSPPAIPPDTPSVAGSVLTEAVMAPNHGLAGGAVDPRAVAPREGATDRAFVHRQNNADASPDRGSYTQTSGPDQQSVADLAQLTLSLDWIRTAGDVQLAATLLTLVGNEPGPTLTRDVSLRIDPGTRYPLDVALVEWREDAGHDAASARLVPQSIPGDPGAFRICWLVNLPTVSRESCTRHTLAAGEFTGVSLMDESGDAPLRIWATVP